MPCDLEKDDRESCILSWHECGDEPAPDALTVEIATANREAVKLALRALQSPRLERVIRLRFGLYDGPALSLRAVGEEMGVGSERVRQMQNKALRIMRFKLSRLAEWGEPPPDRPVGTSRTSLARSPAKRQKKRKSAAPPRAATPRSCVRSLPARPLPSLEFSDMFVDVIFYLAIFVISILLGRASMVVLALIVSGG
ncbi:sigma factor-like helix-turn-helix DNA-binding protein [Hephaestia caeni]|uniref:sigma factor-like helix-turn-helix DNA-binding protein n=1 Tax=Hephaestia caeni TaxID=645617 RepID=UPI000E5B22E3|nr:sigma factor-like helix-turn-helix DNA-binding protein [Hephaestia caeni]